MKATAVARYQQLQAKTGQRPNKRIRKAAWLEVAALVSQGENRDRRALEQWRGDIAKRHMAGADAMYGADRYGRDVQQPLVVPLYVSLPLPGEPEHGFRFVAVEGKRRHLWHDGAWVELSGELMRRVESHGLRTDLAAACAYQEMRRWASHQHRLNFRDQIIDVRAEYHDLEHLKRAGAFIK